MMDTLKSTVVYWKKLRNNEIDHGDILAYRLSANMSKFLFWWTDVDYKKAPNWEKVFYILLSIRWTTNMAFSLVYLGMHWDSKPIQIILSDSVICLAGLVVNSWCYIFPYYRERSSKLLKAVNEINLDILNRNQNFLSNRRASNRLFLILSLVYIVINVVVWIGLSTYAWQFTHTGLPPFNSFLYQPRPYSLTAFVDEILLLGTGFWVQSLTVPYLTTYFEFILRISFYFQVTAKEMRQLRTGSDIVEDEEQRKLESLIKDLTLLYWCVDEVNATIRFYMILFVWFIFTTMGVFLFVILSMGSVLKSLQLLLIPSYLFLLTVIFCAIGQHLKDSADEVRVAIYDCCWYNAPVSFRKLVLNVLTRCTRDVLFSASPFYDLDFALLFRVMKTTYSVLALFRNLIK